HDSGSSPGSLVPPLPEGLRTRALHHRLPLLDEHAKPLWAYRITGQGRYQALAPQFMVIASRDDQPATLWALDNDPRRHWFEFTIEINHFRGARPSNLERGLFFGYRFPGDDGQQRHRFVVLRLDETPTADMPLGQVLLGTAYIEAPTENKQGAINWF